MLPFLQVGSWIIGVYPLAMALGFLAGGSLAWRRLALLGEEKARWQNGLVLILLAILAGLFLPALAETWLVSLFSGQPPGAVVIRVYYGLAGGLAAAILYGRANRLHILRTTDRLAPGFSLGYFIVRLGCLAVGCCGGSETTSWLAMYLPNEAGVWAMRYPTQIISAAIYLVFFILFMNFRRLPSWMQKDGFITLASCFLFCLERFGLEFLRADFRPLFGPFSLPHLWMLAGMGTIAVYWGLSRRRFLSEA